MKKMLLIFLLFFSQLTPAQTALRLKTIARLSGLQENPITGYGLVIGLAGSGDSRRSKDTMQAISNLLQGFGISLNPNAISSRNAASVIITANLPAHAHQGDKLDINVASLGDARSLLGGTLLATPLKGPDNQVYALAQGPLSLGGFKYDSFGNVLQKNHPTAGIIPDGAIVEKTLYNDLMEKTGSLHVILNHPDYTTAYRVETAVNKQFGGKIAMAHSAQDIEIQPPKSARQHFIRFLSEIENIEISSDKIAAVVVNEKSGIIVAGAEVKIDPVSIAYGNLQISIANHYDVSQPQGLNTFTPGIRSVVTPDTSMQVKESAASVVKLKAGSSIDDLIGALTQLHLSTRDIISILESLKRAGALHAELIIQ